MGLWKKIFLCVAVLLIGAGIYYWKFYTNGFVISLAMDQDRYRIYEEIPVHIACARTADSWTVYGPASAPLCDAAIEIWDEKGNLLTTYMPPARRGGLSVSRTIGRNVAVPLEFSFPADITSSDLKDFTVPFYRHIGAYVFTAIWHAHNDGNREKTEIRLVSKPVEIHIIEDDSVP